MNLMKDTGSRDTETRPTLRYKIASGALITFIALAVGFSAYLLFGTTSKTTVDVAVPTVPATEGCMPNGVTGMVSAVSSYKVSVATKDEPQAFRMDSLVNYKMLDGLTIVCKFEYSDYAPVLKGGEVMKVTSGAREL